MMTVNGVNDIDHHLDHPLLDCRFDVGLGNKMALLKNTKREQLSVLNTPYPNASGLHLRFVLILMF